MTTTCIPLDPSNLACGGFGCTMCNAFLSLPVFSVHSHIAIHVMAEYATCVSSDIARCIDAASFIKNVLSDTPRHLFSARLSRFLNH